MASVKPSEINNYLGINLMKNTEDLYKETIKYWGEIKENLNKWKKIPYSEIRSLHIIKNDQQSQCNCKKRHRFSRGNCQADFKIYMDMKST